MEHVYQEASEESCRKGGAPTDPRRVPLWAPGGYPYGSQKGPEKITHTNVSPIKLFCRFSELVKFMLFNFLDILSLLLLAAERLLILIFFFQL